MRVLRIGRGGPVTVFASGARAAIADTRMWDVGLRGTRVFFEYGSIAPWGDGRPRPRREADRDAEELRALAGEHRATRLVGVSRGARAVLGALAREPARFERIALIVPPGGRAPGQYASWLGTLAPDGAGATSADILVIGRRGDRGHPARLAREIAERLSARLELLPSGDVLTTHRDAIRGLLAEFLDR